MPVIILHSEIKAPIETCFNLARSIDLHMISTAHTGEKAIAGRTTGLIELNETVTWRAKHLGVWQNLTSAITAYEYPTFFADEMAKGAFKRFRHEHRFVQHGSVTLMDDTFDFESPLGILGTIANKLFLTKYVEHLLSKRNAVIKEYAENGKGVALLGNSA
jgi:ligand-binding SRPBCC domain-containing protein